MCPNAITQANDARQCSAVVAYTEPVGTHVCAGVVSTSRTAGLGPSSTFGVGAHTETYRVTDVLDRSASCSFVITVADDELPRDADDVSPTIQCPADIVIDAAANDCGQTVTFVAPIGVDNCPGVTTVLTTPAFASGQRFPIGVTTVTYQAQDSSSHSATCSFSVTVQDQTPPTFAGCNGFTTSALSPNECSAFVVYASVTASDACGILTLTRTGGVGSGHAFPVGTTTERYDVVDVNGNSVSCTFDIVVEDDDAPTITCAPDATVNNDAGVCGRTITFSAPSGADECATTVVLDSGLASGSVFPAGVTTEQTFKVTDVGSNTAVCVQRVSVVDVEPPTVVCPPAVVASAEAGLCSARPTWSVPVGADNCVAQTTVPLGASPGDVFGVGLTSVVYETTDGVALTGSCTFSVTVLDTQAPTFATGCAADVTGYANDGGQCGAMISGIETPLALDNCEATVTMTQGHTSGTMFVVGETITRFRAADAADNAALCETRVTVVDTEKPTISCPGAVTVATDSGSTCQGTATWTEPIGADNCLGALTTRTGAAPGTQFDLGSTTVTYTVVDTAGNSASCDVLVTVNDAYAPVLSGCPVSQTVSMDVGVCEAVVSNVVTPSVADACTATVSLTSGHLGTTAFARGLTLVKFEAMDGTNSAVCDATITVADNEAPTLTCPGDVAVAASPSSACDAVVTFAAPTGVSDNCGANEVTVTRTSGQASGTPFAVGVHSVEYTATDAAGNTASCTFSVTVTDATAPMFLSCPASPMTVATSAGLCTGVASFDVAAEDNCAGLVVRESATNSVVAPGSTAMNRVLAIGSHAQRFTATAANGAEAVCEFTIVVADQELPQIVCPVPPSALSSGGVCGATVTFAGATATDNCAGVTVTQTSGDASGSLFPVGDSSVTYTATDASGGVGTCTFLVSVTDGEAPTLTCPTVATVDNTDTNCGETISYATPTVADACGVVGLIPVRTTGLASGVSFPAGQTTRTTYSVTDSGGNTGTCMFDVLVRDLTAPLISCPSLQFVESVPVGTCATVVTFSAATATDNCGTVTVVLSSAGAIPSGGSFPVGQTTQSFTATDASGMTATCTMKVIVAEDEAPTFGSCVHVLCDDGFGFPFTNRCVVVDWCPYCTLRPRPAQCSSRLHCCLQIRAHQEHR